MATNLRENKANNIFYKLCFTNKRNLPMAQWLLALRRKYSSCSFAFDSYICLPVRLYVSGVMNISYRLSSILRTQVKDDLLMLTVDDSLLVLTVNDDLLVLTVNDDLLVLTVNDDLLVLIVALMVEASSYFIHFVIYGHKVGITHNDVNI
jgi:hypothetical protein